MRNLNKKILALLAVAALSAGCISKGEYRDFVRAAKGYREALGPDYVARIQSDQSVPDQVKANRAALDAEFAASIAAAESRLGGLGDDPDAE